MAPAYSGDESGDEEDGAVLPQHGCRRCCLFFCILVLMAGGTGLVLRFLLARDGHPSSPAAKLAARGRAPSKPPLRGPKTILAKSTATPRVVEAGVPPRVALGDEFPKSGRFAGKQRASGNGAALGALLGRARIAPAATSVAVLSAMAAMATRAKSSARAVATTTPTRFPKPAQPAQSSPSPSPASPAAATLHGPGPAQPTESTQPATLHGAGPAESVAAPAAARAGAPDHPGRRRPGGGRWRATPTRHERNHTR